MFSKDIMPLMPQEGHHASGERSPARKHLTLFDPVLMKPALVDSFRKMHPKQQLRNPVMFVVYAGGIIVTLLFIQSVIGQGEARPLFIFLNAVWLWFTV